MLVVPVAELQRLVRELNDEIPDVAAQSLLSELWEGPAGGFSYAALGLALLKAGRVQAAWQALDRAHYLQPENPQVLYHYGLALESAGRPSDACLRYEAALRLYPGFEQARRRLLLLGAPSAARSDPRKRAPSTLPVVVPRPATASPSSPPTSSESALAALPQALPRRYEEPLPDLGWEPEPAPGLDALTGTAVRLWGQQPLLWLVILALPNALAALLLALAPIQSWAAPLVWLLAMGLGAAPAILAMVGQGVHQRPFSAPWNLTPARWLRGTALLILVLLVTVAPTAAGVVLRSPLRGENALLVGLLLAVPFHVLLAPGLVLAATTGPGGGKALWVALRLAEPRTWLHLVLILFLGTLLGVGLLGLDAGFRSLFQGGVEFKMTHLALVVAGISLGESIWAAFITVCGLDALEAIRNPLSEEWELERLTE